MARSDLRFLRLPLCLVLASGAVFAASPPASAATINVGCAGADLISAVEAANATSEADTLNLTAGCTYTLTSRYGALTTGLPGITTPMTIDGNGAIIERATDAQSFGVASITSDLVLSDVTFREFWGFSGAYFNVGGSLTMVDSTITNVPPIGQQDSAIQVSSSGTLAVIDSVIENQFDLDSGTGAAIDNDGYLAVVNSTFRGNHVGNISGGPAVQVGGAIANSGTAQIYGSTFRGNIAGAVGGAISNGAGNLEVHGSTFLSNNANFGAAIYNSSASDLLVEDSYFASNDADLSGGAIDNSTDSLATIRNSSFYANTAGSDGGAILNTHGTRVEYSTFSLNTAGGDGDTVSSPSGLVAFEGSILSGGPGASHCDGNLADFDYNVVHPSLGSCPGTFTVGDPKLTAPADRGGGTFTMALGAGSAAAAAGSATACPDYDQRGVARPVGARCEAGALENRRPPAPGAPAVAAGSSNPNQGAFTLTWSASTDPDGTPVTYRLFRRSASGVVYELVAETSAASYAFASQPEGSWRYAVAATDGNDASGRGGPSPTIVVDLTAPTAPTADGDRDPDFVGDLDWYADTVTVTFSGSTDPDLADGSPGSGVADVTDPQTFSTSGAHTATGSATDGAGNVGSTTSLTVNVDATAPVVTFTSCPVDVILGSTVSATWSASDAHAGLATPGSGSIPLDTSTIGTRSVSASATDSVGHPVTVACEYRVVFNFAGFAKPVVNVPGTTDLRAGDTLPLTFTLGGDKGLAVIATGYPRSAPISCGSSPELTTGDATTAQRALIYTQARGGRYTYFWRTDPAWSATCRQVVVKLVDGTYHRANVRFN